MLQEILNYIKREKGKSHHSLCRMSEVKVKVNPKADVVSSGVATNNKSGGSPSKGRRGYRGGYYNGGTPQKKKFEGAVEELSACIFDCQHNSQAKNFHQHLDTLATYVG